MTPDLVALHEGAARRREAEYDRGVALVAEYRRWLTGEATLYQSLIRTRAIFGTASNEATFAHDAWHACLAEMPATPGDAHPAWRLAESVAS